MAITTPVIDNFNRANGNNVYSNGPWGANPIWGGDNSLVISSNAAKANGGWGDVYTSNSGYTDSEAYATVAATGGTDGYLEIMVRGSGGNSGNPSYYSIQWSQHDNHDDTWRVYRSAGGVYTQLGAQFTQAPAAGHRYGITAVGSTISGYYDTGSGFVTKVTTTDTLHTSGCLGFELYGSSAIDDFGGGAPVAGGTTFNLQANLRGRGGEKLTPALDKIFIGNLDAYGKDKLTPGKTYNGGSANLDAYGRESLMQGLGWGLASNLDGNARESFAENKAIAFNVNLDGYGREVLNPARSVQTGANLDGHGWEQSTPGKTYAVSSNLDGRGGETFTPGKGFSLLGNFLGRAGENLTPGKLYGVTANLYGLGKVSATITKSLSLRLDTVGRGLFAATPQLLSGTQYILSAILRGQGAVRSTPTRTLQTAGTFQGKGDFQPTPTLTSQLKAFFTGKGEVDVRPTLISGVQKLLSASLVGLGRLAGQLTEIKQAGANLDGRGDMAGQPGQTKQAGAVFRGKGEVNPIVGRQSSITGSMRGSDRVSFIQSKAVQLLADLDAGARFKATVQKTITIETVMVGRGWLRALFSPTGIIQRGSHGTIRVVRSQGRATVKNSQAHVEVVSSKARVDVGE